MEMNTTCARLTCRHPRHEGPCLKDVPAQCSCTEYLPLLDEADNEEDAMTALVRLAGPQNISCTQDDLHAAGIPVGVYARTVIEPLMELLAYLYRTPLADRRKPQCQDKHLCLHNNFHTQLCISKFEDTRGLMADIRLWCLDCMTPITFLGLPMGMNLSGATCSPDKREARIAITPEGVTPPVHNGATGFTARYEMPQGRSYSTPWGKRKKAGKGRQRAQGPISDTPWRPDY